MRLIGDQAAEDVLTRVHALLATGVGPAEALAAAQAASDSLAPPDLLWGRLVRDPHFGDGCIGGFDGEQAR
ncbi:MAG: hypothetical protein V9E81_07295 [Marmoricola sp.]